MQELEIVREKIQNHYRVVETDEDLEWNRAIDLCTNIINAHIKHMNDGWIPVDEQMPEEKINPITSDYYEYQVTARFGGDTDVRHYKFGNGHWWNGPGIVDKYVIAWRPLPEPYNTERSERE